MCNPYMKYTDFKGTAWNEDITEYQFWNTVCYSYAQEQFGLYK